MAISRAMDEEGVEIEAMVGAAIIRRNGQQTDRIFFDSFCTRKTSTRGLPSRRYLECLARVEVAVEEEGAAGVVEVVGEEGTILPLLITVV